MQLSLCVVETTVKYIFRFTNGAVYTTTIPISSPLFYLSSLSETPTLQLSSILMSADDPYITRLM